MNLSQIRCTKEAQVQEEKIASCVAPTPFIQTEGLSLYYGEKPAFEAITLPIHTGQITAVVGPSGCGKTSFLMALNRMTDLLPHCRVSGSIRQGALDIRNANTDVLRLRRRIGMIFQKPNPFPLSIRKNLSFPLREHGVRDKNEASAIIEQSLRDVGLWNEVKDRLNSPALSLSGGQQQRLCIARALALRPEAILMDEPCSALDPIAGGIVEDLIVKLCGEYTLLIVTHNLAQAKRIAEVTAFFWMVRGSGRLIEQGPTRQVFESPREALTAAYVNGMRG